MEIISHVDEMFRDQTKPLLIRRNVIITWSSIGKMEHFKSQLHKDPFSGVPANLFIYLLFFFFAGSHQPLNFFFFGYSLVASWLSLLRNMLIIQGLGLCLGVINTLVCDCVHVNVCVLFPQGSY